MSFKTLRDFDLKGKRVLVRADLNVPAKDGKVTDTTRIDRLKTTIDFLTAKGAKTVLLSHFGRPKSATDTQFSQAFLAPVCEKSWGHSVAFAKDCVGEEAAKAIAGMKDGDIVLLENVRFHKGEEANDPAFVAELSKLGDIYVNDAFSAAHRAHASTEGLAHRMPTAAGFLMEAELNALSDALEAPKKPVIAIVGGSKISTKLSVLNNLVQKVDYLFLGGGMANTFFAAQGVEVGKSLCERDMIDEAKKIMATAKKAGCDIVLPIDRVCVVKFGENAPFEIRDANAMPAEEEAVDVGPQTIEKLEDILSGCKTALWNGPMGVFEVKPFDRGTNDLARTVATLTKSGSLVSVAGGGDTVSALENAGAADDFTYISTAGGAFLEWLEGKELPGVAALTAKKAAA
ncbi:MAG TPA: phosphoglycerate kinase [Micavibrio sp.]|nr:phosphoglycerate kinase [Micavibrio sp.]